MKIDWWLLVKLNGGAQRCRIGKLWKLAIQPSSKAIQIAYLYGLRILFPALFNHKNKRTFVLLTSIVDFIKANLSSCFALVIYYIWWIYVVFGFGGPDFDKQLSGKAEKEIIVFITIGLIIAYSSAFLLAASITKKKKKYSWFIAVTLIPLLVVYIMNEMVHTTV